MPRYEYKLIPAPEKAAKIKGVKGPAKFAATIEQVMNELGAQGWCYLRADILPQEERSGLTGKQTTYRTLLVFSRELPSDADAADDAAANPPVFAATPPPAPAPLATPDARDDERDGDHESGALINLFARNADEDGDEADGPPPPDRPAS